MVKLINCTIRLVIHKIMILLVSYIGRYFISLVFILYRI